jgi:LysM domain-containing protein
MSTYLAILIFIFHETIGPDQMLFARYYVIQPNDYCAKIENQFDITFAQLQQWNPVSHLSPFPVFP